MKICVYCASSAKVDNSYFEATEKLAKIFVSANISVVYGGGGIGLMGKLAGTAKFLEDIDGLVTLPGGSGKLEELLEAITLKRLGQFTKPIIILNTNGFYDPLKLMLEKCISENFMDEKHLDMWTFVNEPEDVIESIINALSWDKKAISFATNR